MSKNDLGSLVLHTPKEISPSKDKIRGIKKPKKLPKPILTEIAVKQMADEYPGYSLSY